MTEIVAHKKKTFHETISPLLSLKLKKFENSSTTLNAASCLEIYTIIFNTFENIVRDSKVPLDNEALNYIAQQYYDGILINGKQELDPNIFTQRASLDNIPTPELLTVGTMLRGTDFLIPVVNALKSRGKA